MKTTVIGPSLPPAGKQVSPVEAIEAAYQLGRPMTAIKMSTETLRMIKRQMTGRDLQPGDAEKSGAYGVPFTIDESLAAGVIDFEYAEIPPCLNDWIHKIV